MTRATPIARHRWRQALALGSILAVCTACESLSSAFGPAPTETTLTDVAVRATLEAADPSGLRLIASALYELSTGSLAPLGALDLALDSLRADQLTGRLDLSPCLSDPLRRRGQPDVPRACRVHLRLALQRASRTLDSASAEPVWLSPGRVTVVPGAVALFEIATVQISDSAGGILVAPTINGFIGSRLTLGVVARDATGERVFGRPVVWASNDTTVVTVSAGGEVLARAAGTARVTAVVGGRSAVVTLNISP